MSRDPSSLLSDLSFASLEAQYHDRRLDSLTDADLVRAAAARVAVPRRDPASSFVLHAPLELAARAALLPMVRPADRDAARLRIVSLVAGYDAVDPADVPAQRVEGVARAEDPVAELVAAVGEGDLEAVDRAAQVVARQVRGRGLGPRLAPAVLPLTAAAGHAPIFLLHLARRDPLGGLTVDLLRPLARELARHPDWRVTWTDRWNPQGHTDPEIVAKVLATFPHLGVPGSSFIHPLLMQVDQPGVADERLGPVLGAWNPDAARAVLRVAARSMLHDTPDHAPYGWSHCLTLPQALLGITAGTVHADLGLALAATSVASFRAALGEVEVPTTDPSELPEVDPIALATAAALTHDAHVVKYVLACFDAIDDDPAAERLYLAAGQRLLDVWAANGGDPTDPLA